MIDFAPRQSPSIKLLARQGFNRHWLSLADELRQIELHRGSRHFALRIAFKLLGEKVGAM